ncbi:MAG: SDR family oxidoreductase [Candidatus Nomurabacteria bacterium]|jgi:3-oxoacyl-[acyl-carrier protein] reductase|nr:SDR family oxidoreductase [Candidatus Nomurabacteria bacterium]
MKLQDKIVVVTGLSSGIGVAVVKAFAEAGAKVVLNYHINQAGGEAALKSVRQLSPESILVQADLSTEAGVDRLFDAAVSQFGRIDILVNNAGIGTDKVPFMEADFLDLKEMIDTDLTGLMLASQRAAKIMLNQPGGGKILNTSSVRGWQFGGRAPVYAGCKAAVNNFTSSFAKMVAPKIAVNAVAPGYVRTRSYDGMTDDEIDSWLNATLLKRFIKAEEIADAFLFLARNDAMTGQVIYVDAGFTCQIKV